MKQTKELDINYKMNGFIKFIDIIHINVSQHFDIISMSDFQIKVC